MAIVAINVSTGLCFRRSMFPKVGASTGRCFHRSMFPQVGVSKGLCFHRYRLLKVSTVVGLIRAHSAISIREKSKNKPVPAVAAIYQWVE